MSGHEKDNMKHDDGMTTSSHTRDTAGGGRGILSNASHYPHDHNHNITENRKTKQQQQKRKKEDHSETSFDVIKKKKKRMKLE